MKTIRILLNTVGLNRKINPLSNQSMDRMVLHNGQFSDTYTTVLYIVLQLNRFVDQYHTVPYNIFSANCVHFTVWSVTGKCLTHHPFNQTQYSL